MGMLGRSPSAGGLIVPDDTSLLYLSWENLREVPESVWDDETSRAYGLVLYVGGFQSGVGDTASVTELNLSREHLGASTNGRGDDRLLNDTLFDGVDDTVFFDATDFTEEDEHLALAVLLVTKEVVDNVDPG